jgi:hypothetical protein
MTKKKKPKDESQQQEPEQEQVTQSETVESETKPDETEETTENQTPAQGQEGNQESTPAEEDTPEPEEKPADEHQDPEAPARRGGASRSTAAPERGKRRYSFPTVSLCPRCRGAQTRATSTQKNVQYRICLAAICRKRYHVMGTKISPQAKKGNEND